MDRIYCISGLGADPSVFSHVAIDGYELIPVQWVPFLWTDTVTSYATKLIPQIKDASPVILGLSFGGMLAVEIAKQIPTKKVFIVSSAKGPAEMGQPGGGIVKWLIESRLLPPFIFTIPNRKLLELFGVETEDEKQLMRSVIRHSDGRFMKWALHAMLHWKDTPAPSTVVHIHGTADKIIPAKNVHPDYWISGGSHIMIYNRSQDVNKIISETLAG